MIITLLLIYCLIVTCYLLYSHRLQHKETELDKLWKEITDKPNPTAADIRAITRVAKVRQTDIPWYERSLSTIGIVAFFSMIVATSFQTVNSAKTDIESSYLRQEIKALEAQRAGWKTMMKNLSEVIILKQMSNGKLETSEKDVLKQRLTDLDQAASGTQEDEIEKLKIYLALKQFDNASALVEKSQLLADQAPPETLLFLAETSFIDGARARTKLLLSKFEPKLSKQPVEWQLRFLVISAALDSNPGAYSKDVAALKGTSLNEAEEWLNGRVDELRLEARRRASVSNSPDAISSPT